MRAGGVAESRLFETMPWTMALREASAPAAGAPPSWPYVGRPEKRHAKGATAIYGHGERLFGRL